MKKTYGNRTYPVEYTYDVQGRMKTMKTWRSFGANGGTAITTWNYHTTRGWLLSKDYADATSGAAGSVGPDYTYTAGGRLKTRTWARNHSGGNRIVTTYKYGFEETIKFPDLASVDYNDGVTPNVAYGYDRRGRVTLIPRDGTTTTRTLDDSGQLLSESYTGTGTLVGLSVNATYDSLLRRQTFSTKNGGSTIGSSTYSYDTASRLDTVTDGTYSATYAYLPNSSLIDTVTFKQSSKEKQRGQEKGSVNSILLLSVHLKTHKGQISQLDSAGKRFGYF